MSRYIFENIDLENVTPNDIKKLVKDVLIKKNSILHANNNLKNQQDNMSWTLLCIQIENLVHYIDNAQGYFESHQKKLNRTQGTNTTCKSDDERDEYPGEWPDNWR